MELRSKSRRKSSSLAIFVRSWNFRSFRSSVFRLLEDEIVGHASDQQHEFQDFSIDVRSSIRFHAHHPPASPNASSEFASL
jgi:hypothetical protein